MKRKPSNGINNINKKKIDGPEFNRSEMTWLLIEIEIRTKI